MKNKDRVPGPPPPVAEWPVVTVQLPDLQRDVRRRSADRRRVRARLPEGQARDSGARRLDRRDVRHRASWPFGVRRRAGSTSRTCIAPIARASRRARSTPGCSVARGRVRSPSSTPTSCRRRTSCGAPCRTSQRRQAGRRPGALGPSQSRLLAADADPGHPARRPLRARARRPQPLRLLLQLQRHGRRLAARSAIDDARRLAARHAHRGSRPELPRAAARLEVPVPARTW